MCRLNPSVNNEHPKDLSPKLKEMANISKNKGQNLPALKSEDPLGIFFLLKRRGHTPLKGKVSISR